MRQDIHVLRMDLYTTHQKMLSQGMILIFDRVVPLKLCPVPIGILWRFFAWKP